MTQKHKFMYMYIFIYTHLSYENVYVCVYVQFDASSRHVLGEPVALSNMCSLWWTHQESARDVGKVVPPTGLAPTVFSSRIPGGIEIISVRRTHAQLSCQSASIQLHPRVYNVLYTCIHCIHPRRRFFKSNGALRSIWALALLYGPQEFSVLCSHVPTRAGNPITTLDPPYIPTLNPHFTNFKSTLCLPYTYPKPMAVR